MMSMTSGACIVRARKNGRLTLLTAVGATCSIVSLAFSAPLLRAQDTLRLEVLERSALERDPRARQLALHTAASQLRLRNIAAQQLPQLQLQGHATQQSEVTTIPLRLPGIEIPMPHRDNYDAAFAVDQSIYDPTVAARRRSERAQLAEDLARVRVELYALREQIEASFFTAALQQRQSSELTATERDLAGRLSVVQAQVRNGTALPGDADAVEAEMLTLRQSRDAVDYQRGAELSVLAVLTGLPVSARDVLEIPTQSVAADARDLPVDSTAVYLPDSLHLRPEYEQFARTRELLEREADVAAAAGRPRLSAFGQAAYGRPGLNFLRPDLHDYWQVGLRFEWRPWDWGTSERNAEALRLQGRVVETEEAVFSRSLVETLTRTHAAIAQVERALATDTTIVKLREHIDQQARRQLDEGVIMASQYIERRNDLLRARLAADARRVQLAQAIANYHMAVGMDAVAGAPLQSRSTLSASPAKQ